MGRTLKRVALDFKWPLNKVWEGYINPWYRYSSTCAECDGSGYSPEANRLAEQWYGNEAFDPVAYGCTPIQKDHPAIVALATRNVKTSPDYYGYDEFALQREMTRLWKHFRNQWCHNLNQDDVNALIAADRLWDFTRVPRNEEQEEIVRKKIEDGGNSWLPESNGYVPTAKEVNDCYLSGFGHDAINRSVCVRARCEREGYEVLCKSCEGSGTTWVEAKYEKMAEEWVDIEPPAGPGYQLWETTSEGSPVSPVFETIEELCEYAAKNCTTFGAEKTSALKWREMLDDDFVVHKDEYGNVFM